MNSEKGQIRGELAIGRGTSRHNLYSVDPMRIRTMMQSYASAAKLRGGGPILNRGAQAMSNIGLPPPRIVICSALGTLVDCRNLLLAGTPSRGRAKGQTCRHLASGRQSPERDQELAGERYDHGLARRAASICGSCPIPRGQRAVPLVH